MCGVVLVYRAVRTVPDSLSLYTVGSEFMPRVPRKLSTDGLGNLARFPVGWHSIFRLPVVRRLATLQSWLILGTLSARVAVWVRNGNRCISCLLWARVFRLADCLASWEVTRVTDLLTEPTSR